jgi:hypothetical protein
MSEPDSHLVLHVVYSLQIAEHTTARTGSLP